tara:strand:- start:435 stop:878 length:444 start_codon:yes stop_codon:yes gene_type:complete
MKGSYQKGKKGEKDSEAYLKNFGFIRPGEGERENIKQKYERAGILIKETAFDYIEEQEVDSPLPTLYELKTAGKDRIEEVGDGWKGFGFTYTNNEARNAKALGEKYKFIFLDLKKQCHKILNERDFLNDEASLIYETKSIFIRCPLK